MPRKLSERYTLRHDWPAAAKAICFTPVRAEALCIRSMAQPVSCNKKYSIISGFAKRQNESRLVFIKAVLKGSFVMTSTELLTLIEEGLENGSITPHLAAYIAAEVLGVDARTTGYDDSMGIEDDTTRA